jgi:hypothetical protein
MKSKTQYMARGPFTALDLGAGNWVLRQTTGSAQIYLRLTASDATKPALICAARNLAVDWRDDAVVVSWTSSAGTDRLTALSVAVHESKERLYDALPLAEFDVAARRFWRRVFRVMRLPGGRFLLRFLARGRS